MPANAKRRLTLMVRDPHCLFVYWETPEDSARLTIYQADAAGNAERPVHSADVGGTGSYYAQVEAGGAQYVATLAADGSAEIRSQVVRTPPGRPSERTDPEWPPIPSIHRRVGDYAADAGSLFAHAHH